MPRLHNFALYVDLNTGETKIVEPLQLHPEKALRLAIGSRAETENYERSFKVTLAAHLAESSMLTTREAVIDAADQFFRELMRPAA